MSIIILYLATSRRQHSTHARMVNSMRLCEMLIILFVWYSFLFQFFSSSSLLPKWTNSQKQKKLFYENLYLYMAYFFGCSIRFFCINFGLLPKCVCAVFSTLLLCAGVVAEIRWYIRLHWVREHAKHVFDTKTNVIWITDGLTIKSTLSAGCFSRNLSHFSASFFPSLPFFVFVSNYTGGLTDRGLWGGLMLSAFLLGLSTLDCGCLHIPLGLSGHAKHAWEKKFLCAIFVIFERR